tara:strand:+ start:720 stop:1013 length:294 start_codon:yes stop_codon:yes gene_type:complete
MSLQIIDYREFLNVLENQGEVDLGTEPYVKELQECQESHSASCCGSKTAMLKNCNLKLYAILDEALTSRHDLRDKIKKAFGGQEVTFDLSGKKIILN